MNTTKIVGATRSRADNRLRPTVSAVAALRNLGPKTAMALAQVGIGSVAQLRRMGAVAAYQRLKQQVPGTSLNALYALVGALEAVDWREIRRTRKLALLLAIETDAPARSRGSQTAAGSGRRASAQAATKTTASARAPTLADLRNIGPAMLRDFDVLGITTVAQLARYDADALYAELQRRTGTRHDPCVWDTFAAAIHQARTGEALPWWHFTTARKQQQAARR